MAQQFSINTRLQQLRRDYGKNVLLETDCDPNPFVQFEAWLTEAMERDSGYANAMTLSTVSETGMPDSRVVLLRNVSYGGLTFFTNYNSAKGKQIAQNPKACLLFFWKDLERQVKIQGEIKFLPVQESEEYFKSRPFESQIGAWASRQSETIENRQNLDARYEKELGKYEGKTVPRPEHWGGYVLLPVSFEFWQGRSGRLHDRMRYIWNAAANSWKIERLMP